MEATPVSLLERVRKREDDSAWSRFIDLYTPIIYQWVRRIGWQEADAVDLVQDVFAILIQKMSQFQYDSKQSFRAWLKTVVMNKVREQARRKGEEQLSHVEALEQSEESIQFWEEECQQIVLRRAIHIMQNDFHATTWKACWGVVVEQKPASEVASSLGITIGAVYAARFRVMARLRQELAGMLD